MALAAILWEVGSFVIRVGCVEEIRTVARIAVGRRTGELNGVARGAIETDVCAFENRSWRMVELCASPVKRGRTMTLNAIAAESGENVIGIGGRRKVARMARLTFGRSPCILIAKLALMTGLAIGNRMRAHERKSAGGM